MIFRRLHGKLFHPMFARVEARLKQVVTMLPGRKQDKSSGAEGIPKRAPNTRNRYERTFQRRTKESVVPGEGVTRPVTPPRPTTFSPCSSLLRRTRYRLKKLFENGVERYSFLV